MMSTAKKRLLLSAPVAVFAVLAASCAGSSSSPQTSPPASTAGESYDVALFKQLPSDIQSSREISFGAEWATPPYISVAPNDTSKPIGITPDLAAAMADVLGVKATWKNLQWPAQLPGLQSGNIDALFGQVGASKEREQSVADLIAYSQAPIGLLVRSGDEKKLSSLADACGTKIAVPTGSQQSAVVAGNSRAFCTEKGRPEIVSVSYPGSQAAIVALRAGGVDGWLDNYSAVRGIAAQQSSLFTVTQLPASEIDPYMSTTNVIAVSKSQPDLTNTLAAALRELVANGKYQQIMEKWNSAADEISVEAVKVNPYTGLPAGKKAGA